MTSVQKSPEASQESSPSNSISAIRLDELSSFGATKQNRLPALIKLTEVEQNRQQAVAMNSMPHMSDINKDTQQVLGGDKANSMPAQVELVAGSNELARQQLLAGAEKENVAEESDDFQLVDMQHEEEEQQQQAGDSMGAEPLVGPSLPHLPARTGAGAAGGAHEQELLMRNKEQIDKSLSALQSSLPLAQSGQLGDSLIEMIINLRDDNQNLIRALEVNNDYVKERLSEFKRVQEDAKRREAQFAHEKAELEHQVRKVQRQNSVLSERLKSMEAKLRDMKLEVSESLNAAHSSRASSLRGGVGGVGDELATGSGNQQQLYPLIDHNDSFSNAALAKASERDSDESSSDEDEQRDEVDPHAATTMQVDAASCELLNEGDQESGAASKRPADFAYMSRHELSKHFDAKKVDFYAIDDPMKQCDKLEQQLNDIGKRDYEICLLQQQLNIYRQDFRLERMQKLEARIQIEKLKNDIDRLCLERLQSGESSSEAHKQQESSNSAERRISDGLGRFGHRLTKKAARQAAKAAKYAAKQAHLEEKAASALARVAAARANSASHSAPPQPHQQADTSPKQALNEQEAQQHHHHSSRHHRHHHHHHHSGRPRGSGIGSEVVNDLLSTANKAMLTGYKMASTHVNLALDKLSQYEQQQASHLEKNKQQQVGPKAGVAPSAPVEPPSID